MRADLLKSNRDVELSDCNVVDLRVRSCMKGGEHTQRCRASDRRQFKDIAASAGEWDVG